MENLDFKKLVALPQSIQPEAYFFIYHNHSIFVEKDNNGEVTIPLLKMKDADTLVLEDICCIGLIGDRACYSAHAPSQSDVFGLNPINIRALYDKVDTLFRKVAGYARQIHDWNLNFKYCGRCGSKTVRKHDEQVRVCSRCKLMSYPRISPATIIAVVNKDKLLLARGVNFPNKKMFSVLAGFVEPDETLEECVKREVFEETGIKIKNLKYFGSQPWPFPDSLMIGFTAEYESGELLIDTDEITEAMWFTHDNLPMIPSEYTIARELIDWFVEKSQAKLI